MPVLLDILDKVKVKVKKKKILININYAFCTWFLCYKKQFLVELLLHKLKNGTYK